MTKIFPHWAMEQIEIDRSTPLALKLVRIGTKVSLTGAIFETGAYGVPSKSPKSFICGGVRQTINLMSPGKGAPPPTPSWGLQ